MKTVFGRLMIWWYRRRIRNVAQEIVACSMVIVELTQAGELKSEGLIDLYKDVRLLWKLSDDLKERKRGYYKELIRLCDSLCSWS
jgi:hypothetical protein